MSVQVEKLEKNMAKLTIEVPAEEFEKAVQSVYQRNKNKFSIPGFRKGKVPRQMIEKMYGVGVFYEEAINDVMPMAYEDAVNESGLDVVSRPAIDVTQVEAGKPLVFTAEVAVKPEVTLGQYKGIEIEAVEIAVSDEDVEAEIKREQEKNATVITVTDRAIEDGDTAVIDYEGFCDGVPFEGGKAEEFPLVIGSGQFIPGFEAQLIGKNAGEEVEVNVTFPTPYQAKELEGKDAMFKVKIHEIKGKILPELDDEFASEVSDFETMDEYREDVKKNLLEKRAADAKCEKENRVVDKAVENAQMEIPEAMIESQAENQVDDFARRLQGQGMSLDMYMQYTGLTREAMIDQAKGQAESNIRIRLMLEAVAKAENIEASEEECEAELVKMAEGYGMEVEMLKNYFGEREMNQIKADLAVQKAIDLLVAEAVEK
ncbi:MAG: trigger factor [Lachnospiraceae bacterium]|nr:trigger factor [Lachnospiraceae bacterium]